MKTAKGGLFRGADQRTMRWCDMFIVEIPSSAVGPDVCWCLCFVSHQGKKNQVCCILVYDIIVLTLHYKCMLFPIETWGGGLNELWKISILIVYFVDWKSWIWFHAPAQNSSRMPFSFCGDAIFWHLSYALTACPRLHQERLVRYLLWLLCPPSLISVCVPSVSKLS